MNTLSDDQHDDGREEEGNPWCMGVELADLSGRPSFGVVSTGLTLLDAAYDLT